MHRSCLRWSFNESVKILAFNFVHFAEKWFTYVSRTKYRSIHQVIGYQVGIVFPLELESKSQAGLYFEIFISTPHLIACLSVPIENYQES